MRYVGSVAAGFVVAGLVIAATVAVSNQPTWWRGFGAATLGAAASLLVSCAIVLPAFGRDATTLASALLVGGAVRAATLGLIVVAAIKAGGYPMNATLLFAALYYAAIVAVEAGALWTFVGRAATLAPSQTSARHETASLHPTRDRA